MKYTIGTLILALIGLVLMTQTRPDKRELAMQRNAGASREHASHSPPRTLQSSNRSYPGSGAATTEAELSTINRQIAIVERQLKYERRALTDAKLHGKITTRGIKVDGLYQQLRALHHRRNTLYNEN